MRHHRHPGPADGDVQLRHRLERHDRAGQRPFPCVVGEALDLFPEGFRDPFHRLGLDDHAGQHVQIRPPLSERFLGPDAAHHATHPRAERSPHDVQRLLLRDHPIATPSTVVVRPPDRHRAQHREDLLRPVLDKGCLVRVAAGHLRPPIAPTVGVDQLLQQDGTHLAHRSPEGHLGGLQVQVTTALALLEDAPDQTVYFLHNLLANRLRNFFQLG